MSGRCEKLFVILTLFLFGFCVRAQDAKQKEIRLTLSVTGERGKYVGDLKAENFQITIDEKAQEIAAFGKPFDAPATIVFLVDVSGSQGSIVRGGIVKPFLKQIWQFIKDANPDNEYVLIAFNNNVELVVDKTADRKTLADGIDKIAEIEPHGNTAFYKAVLAGIERAQAGKYAKRVLIACADGGDNMFPKIKSRDITESLKRSDILFYSLSFGGEENTFSPNVSPTEADGRELLYKLADVGGGRALFPATSIEMAESFERIAVELKNQYSITIRVGGSDDAAKPDKWREVKVKAALLSIGDKKTKFDARTRSGFYQASAK